MSKSYKLIDVVGTSDKSYDDAVKNAVAEAQKSLSGVTWFEVTEFRGAVHDSKVEFQATVRLGFKLRD